MKIKSVKLICFSNYEKVFYKVTFSSNCQFKIIINLTVA